jgi:hypothetical protein
MGRDERKERIDLWFFGGGAVDGETLRDVIKCVVRQSLWLLAERPVSDCYHSIGFRDGSQRHPINFEYETTSFATYHLKNGPNRKRKKGGNECRQNKTRID